MQTRIQRGTLAARVSVCRAWRSARIRVRTSDQRFTRSGVARRFRFALRFGLVLNSTVLPSGSRRRRRGTESARSAARTGLPWPLACASMRTRAVYQTTAHVSSAAARLRYRHCFSGAHRAFPYTPSAVACARWFLRAAPAGARVGVRQDLRRRVERRASRATASSAPRSHRLFACYLFTAAAPPFAHALPTGFCLHALPRTCRSCQAMDVEQTTGRQRSHGALHRGSAFRQRHSVPVRHFLQRARRARAAVLLCCLWCAPRGTARGIARRGHLIGAHLRALWRGASAGMSAALASTRATI